jgi:predicted kinase
MEKNNKLFVLVGPPGAGKTTKARKMLLQNSNAIRVNRDEARLTLRNQVKVEPKVETLINKLTDETILNALSMKFDVIVDNTNLKASVLDHYKELVKYVADIEFILCDISLKKALEQNKMRPHPVEENYLKEKFHDWEVLRDSYVFQNVRKKPLVDYIVPDYTLTQQQAVIFDVDGTLALLNNRGPYDYDKVHYDNVNEVVKEQIVFHKSLGRTILIVSGRDEVCRKDTEDWFELYGIEYDQFFMRTKDDGRKDSIVKKEIYENLIENNYNVICVYDDRKSVVDAWRDMGLFVFDCNQYKHIF